MPWNTLIAYKSTKSRLWCMNKNKMLKSIASILSHKFDNNQVIDLCNNFKIDWDYMVRVASEHLVLPTIYCRLKTRNLLHVLPAGLEVYLKDITQINRNRNKALLKEARNIHVIFKSNNINYVFLKGMALLKGEYYSDIGERMMGDIDLLVHPLDIGRAYKLLKNNGYYSIQDKHNKSYFEHRHLPRLLSDKYIAAVELHDKLLNGKNTFNLSPITYLETKISIDNTPIPSKQSLLQHNVINFQVNDKALIYGAFSLRNAYDTLLILEKEKLSPGLGIFNLQQNIVYNTYFQLVAKYFQCFSFNPKSSRYKILSRFFVYKMNHPRLNKSYVFGVNLIRFLLIVMSRLKLFLINKAYRKDVLSKEVSFSSGCYNFFYQKV